MWAAMPPVCGMFSLRSTSRKLVESVTIGASTSRVYLVSLRLPAMPLLENPVEVRLVIMANV
jgi:hypothetical protein